MKLTVQIVETLRGPAIMLCDDGGIPLPGQAAVITRSETDTKPGTITVEFVIDGKDVSLRGELASAAAAGRAARAARAAKGT